MFKFPCKTKAVIIFGLQRLSFLQKSRKFQRAVFEKNAKNPHFWAFWAKKADFGPFWPKRGHFRIFGEKAKTSLFYSFFNTKNQKILMCGFSGKWARTYGRTYGGESKGPSTPSRDQKVIKLHKTTILAIFPILPYIKILKYKFSVLYP